MPRSRVPYALALLALAGPAERPARAHATCFAETCCAPHLGVTSNDVCEFTDCHFDGTLYNRHYCCAFPLEDDPTTCLWVAGSSHATAEHEVSYDDDEVDHLGSCDNTCPVCAAAEPSPRSLVPDRGRLQAVSIQGLTDPDGDALSLQLVGVTRREADGDVESVDDAMCGAGNTVLLRPVGSGGGNTTYTIAFWTDDGLGGTCAGRVDVCVPSKQNPSSCPP